MIGKNIVLLALALLLAGCGESLEKESHLRRCDSFRIVAMAPNTAEILFALGLSNEVVGVSRFTTYPPEAKEKPVVGGLYDPNWEMIVALQPDLVVGLETQKEIEGQLNALGIDFLGVSHESIDDIIQSILIIGEACGATNEAARLFQGLMPPTKVYGIAARRSATTLFANVFTWWISISERDLDFCRIHQGLEKQTASFSKPWKNPKPKVLVCVGHDETLSQMYIAARGTFYDELIERAGGINACEISAGNYPEISPEGLAAMRPDVVIDIFPNIGKNQQEVSNVWKPFCEKVAIISDDYASIPGPRFVLLLEDFIKAIQPKNGSE